jgi:hypothetical protein
MLAFLLATASLAIMASANPFGKRGDVHCGTAGRSWYSTPFGMLSPELTLWRAGDATLSDCEALINDPAIWNAKLVVMIAHWRNNTDHHSFNLDNTCHFSSILANKYAYPASNLACNGVGLQSRRFRV